MKPDSTRGKRNVYMSLAAITIVMLLGSALVVPSSNAYAVSQNGKGNSGGYGIYSLFFTLFGGKNNDGIGQAGSIGDLQKQLTKDDFTLKGDLKQQAKGIKQDIKQDLKEIKQDRKELKDEKEDNHDKEKCKPNKHGKYNKDCREDQGDQNDQGGQNNQGDE